MIANHPDSPCRPTVRVLTDSIFARGARVKKTAIDLRVRKELFVAEVDGIDVTAAVKFLDRYTAKVLAPV